MKPKNDPLKYLSTFIAFYLIAVGVPLAFALIMMTWKFAIQVWRMP